MTKFRLIGRYGNSVALWVLATPSPPLPDEYASYAISDIPMKMDPEDPFNWDVDRAVRELCTNRRKWKVPAALSRMPDPVKFEEALVAHQIDGFTLLTDVTEDVLENKLGLRVFGQLAAVKQIIRELRQLSPQYELWVTEFGSDASLAAHRLNTSTNAKKRPRSLTPGNIKKDDGDGKSGTPGLAGNWVAETPENKRRRLEDITSEMLSNNLAIFQPTDQGGDYATSLSETIIPMEHDHAGQVAINDALMEVGTPENGRTKLHEVESAEKKIKRIAPTLITSTVDKERDREIMTQADLSMNNEPHPAQPGIIYKDQDGRKRLMLVSPVVDDFTLPKFGQEGLRNAVEREAIQLGGQRGLESAQQILRTPNIEGDKECVDDLSDGYLGKKPHTVDEVFYPGIAIGNELPLINTEQSFCQVTTGVSSGRRLYVNSLMKHYLRSKRQTVHRNGNRLVARIPYSARLAPAHHVPSFTLVRAKNGSSRATRENLLMWPEVDPSPIIKTDKVLDADDQRQALFDLPDNLPLGGPSSYDNWDPDVLEKYRYIHGGDLVLPLYGESDEDGEYDVETWHEIEEERGILDKPLLAVKKRQLTEEEVNVAMDEAVAQMLVRWSTEKLPRRQLQAWSLWRKSRRQGTKRRLMEEARQHIDRINNDRLPQMRSKILEEIWTSKKMVRWQTKIMEQSIFDREDLIWQISILKMSAEPEKPLPPIAKIRKPRRITSEQDWENIENTDVEDSYDELDDFIVDDDGDVMSGEADNTRADDEAEESGTEFHEAFVPDMTVNESPESDHRSPASVFHGESEPELQMPVQVKAWSTPSRLSLRLAPTDKNQPELPPTQRKAIGKQGAASEIIDLTQLTSDASGPDRRTRTGNVDLESKRKNNLKITFKGKSPATGDGQSTIKTSAISSPSASQTLALFTDVAAIAKMSFKDLEQAGNQDGILIRLLSKMDDDPKTKLLSLFRSIQAPEMWAQLVDIMHARRDDNFAKVKGMDRNLYKTLSSVIPLFSMYVDCQKQDFSDKLSRKTVAKLKSNEQNFNIFHEKCCKILSVLLPASSDSDSEPLMIGRRRANSIVLSDCDSEDEPNCTPLKLRKKKIHEDEQARNLREQDQLRISEQNERRIILRQRLALSGNINADGARVIINDAKLDDQGFIYVHEDIQKRIKNHQIEGIRFMWNQIVANNLPQGCLLAHTMGLGKTMQVITLLVAITEAAQSPEESISSQIPESLRRSQTLVLCPPGLIDNWVDEFLTWVPLNSQDEPVLGNCLKIDSSMLLSDRLQEIDAWYRSSGVLIIGYEMFRKLILNPIGQKGALLSNEDHERVLEQLLNGPSVVVADEAHRMKNSDTGLTKAGRRFRSRSRIALTGSPLANNVEEYHAMIEWVAPNYLGPIAEFRAKYVEPIEGGLWNDSTALERRRSLKMLGVLKEDLAPKVHRADMSALRDELKPKTEFVITVPLTTLQKKAYTLYVRSMLREGNDLTKSGQLQTTTLWHWLAVLSLLCNHPACFQEKLQISWDGAHKILDAKSSEEDSKVWKAGVSAELIRQESELFRGFGSPIDDINNSNKVKILERILDAAKTAGDKVLVFSQSIRTLNFLERLCRKNRRIYARLDGKTKMNTRQASSKAFNVDKTELFLISTTAGGLGLNLPGANRVVIFDFKFNPINEEQAIGRAYRIGQKKPVYVYKFVAGGTFEDCVHNRAVFKIQLASRVVDKKNPVAWAKRNIGEFLFEPKDVQQQDLSSFRGKDPRVLDKLLDFKDPSICGIVISDSFQRDDNDELTVEEQKEVRQLINEEQLKRLKPAAWRMHSNSREQDGTATAALGSSTQLIADQNALLPSDYRQHASVSRVIPADSHPTARPEFQLNFTAKKVSSPRPSPDLGREMAPIAATNTKIHSSDSANRFSFISTFSNQHNRPSSVEEVSPNESNHYLGVQNFGPRPGSVELQGDATSSTKRKLPWKSLLDSRKPLHASNSPEIRTSHVSPEKILRVAIKQAIGINTESATQSNFSAQRIDEVVRLLWSALERTAPDSYYKVAQDLRNKHELVLKVLLGQITINDLVEQVLNRPAKSGIFQQASVPGFPSILSPTRIQDPKNSAGASSEVLAAKLLSHSILPLPPLTKSNASSAVAPSAVKNGRPVADFNRQEFAQALEATIRATLQANKPDISFVIPEFSREYYADIANTVAFEIVAKARDMSHFETVTAAAIQEISKYSVLSDIMNAPDEAKHFARKIVSQSRRASALGLDRSSNVLSKRPNQLHPSSLPPNRSRGTMSRKPPSPHALAERKYLQTLSSRRGSRTSDIMRPQKRDSSPKSNNSTDRKLPAWAMSNIKAANVENRRCRTPSIRNSPIEIAATP